MTLSMESVKVLRNLCNLSMAESFLFREKKIIYNTNSGTAIRQNSNLTTMITGIFPRFRIYSKYHDCISMFLSGTRNSYIGTFPNSDNVENS